MRKTIFYLTFVILFSLSGNAQNQGFPLERQEALKAVFKKYIEIGIPGFGITVYTPETGYWTHSEGLANLEKKIPLTNEHKFYLQSVSKTYMAVLILKLHEQGKVNLDASITDYVAYPWLTSIVGSSKVTVRMLLNHTSGLPEYSTDPLLVSRIIHDPLTVISVTDMLSHIDGKDLEFEPGSKYTYRNTNYELLSLIADEITGDHVAFMNEEILSKSDLNETVYLSASNHKTDLNIVDAYWDLLLEGIPTNVSKLQRANVSSMKGDDGMVATTLDAVNFLKALTDGKILKPETLDLMQHWVTNDKGQKKYGLGIQYYDLDVTYAIGHSGGGIGAGCVLLYLPELNAIVFLATNFNTMMDSPIRRKAENLQLEVLSALFM